MEAKKRLTSQPSISSSLSPVHLRDFQDKVGKLQSVPAPAQRELLLLLLLLLLMVVVVIVIVVVIIIIITSCCSLALRALALRLLLLLMARASAPCTFHARGKVRSASFFNDWSRVASRHLTPWAPKHIR